MNFSFFKNRTVMEILSITGIMALIFYVDVNFGLFEFGAQLFLNWFPGMNAYLVTAVGSMWIGLLIYSYFKKQQSNFANRAREYIQVELDNQKLINSLTGLPNRKGLEVAFNDTALLREYRHWSVLGIEISNIKTLKNVHGSRISEETELAIARFLEELSHGGEFLAHDEQSVFYFVHTCEASDEVEFRIDHIVERITSFTGSGFAVDGIPVNLQIKFAIVSRYRLIRSIVKPERDGIAKRIGFTLQQPYGHGKGVAVVFDRQMEAEMKRQTLVESSLPDAIGNNDIIPYFQPFIDIKTGRITGFEVLARWAHATEGWIQPDDFISVAEKQGLLGTMTLCVLRQACIEAGNWPDHVVLAINISPTDLRNETMINKLVEVLEETGINPRRIEIEITENAFIEDPEGVNDVLIKLKELGISISIDDFGTGFSSLHQLRLLPFDKIKIDQSFIKNISTSPADLAIVTSVIELGKSLGLPITAEGIEFGDCRDILEKLGCTHGQGFLFAKPMSGDEVAGLFRYRSNVSGRAARAA